MHSANRGSMGLWWLLVMLVVLSLLGMALAIGEREREQEREAFRALARRYAVESGLNWALSYTHVHGLPTSVEEHVLQIDEQQVRVRRRPLSESEAQLESRAETNEVSLQLKVAVERRENGEYEVRITGTTW